MVTLHDLEVATNLALVSRVITCQSQGIILRMIPCHRAIDDILQIFCTFEWLSAGFGPPNGRQ